MSIVPDWMDSPYGIWADYGPWAGLGKTTHLALHPGMVQHRQAVLATLALNGNDDLDGFSTTYGADDEEGGGSSGSGSGNLFPGLATNVLLPRYADEFVLELLRKAKDVGVVLCETSGPEKAVEGAGPLETINRSQFA